MQLTYRGIPYTSSLTTVRTAETTTVAKFRGLTYKVRRSTLAAGKMDKLVYRGVKAGEPAAGVAEPALV